MKPSRRTDTERLHLPWTKVYREGNDLVIRRKWWSRGLLNHAGGCLFMDFITAFFIKGIIEGKMDIATLPAMTFVPLWGTLMVALNGSLILFLFSHLIIRISPRELRISYGPLPWFGACRYRRKDIQQIYCHDYTWYDEHKLKKGLIGPRCRVSAVLTNGRNANLFCWPGLEDQARQLEKLLEKEMGIRNKKVAGELTSSDDDEAEDEVYTTITNVPPDTRKFRFIDGAVESKLILARQYHIVGLIGAMLIGCVFTIPILATILHGYLKGTPLPPQGYLLFLFPAIGIFLLYFCVAGLVNRTTVTIGPNLLTVQHGPMPAFWRLIQDTASIREILIDAYYDNRGGEARRSFVIKAEVDHHKPRTFFRLYCRNREMAFVNRWLEWKLELSDLDEAQMKPRRVPPPPKGILPVPSNVEHLKGDGFMQLHVDSRIPDWSQSAIFDGTTLTIARKSWLGQKSFSLSINKITGFESEATTNIFEFIALRRIYGVMNDGTRHLIFRNCRDEQDNLYLLHALNDVLR